MQITNLPTHDRKYVPLRIVSGYAYKLGGAMLADCTNVLAELEYNAIQNMIKNAERLNADAIINYKISLSHTQHNFMLIVNGTAIKYI